MELQRIATTDSTAASGCTATPAPAAPCQSTPAAATEADRRDGVQGQGPDRREGRVDRRTGLDRRVKTAAQSGYDGPDRRSGEDRRASLERRRGPGRRRSDDRKAAEEGEMNAYQFEFVMAIETYKRINKRLYPTWTEILEILHKLGYRKVLDRTIKLNNAPEPELFDL